MNNRTTGIVAIVLTSICCACPGLLLCIFGGSVALGRPLRTLNGLNQVRTMHPAVGIGLICLSLLLILIPVVISFFVFRNKPAGS